MPESSRHSPDASTKVTETVSSGTGRSNTTLTFVGATLSTEPSDGSEDKSVLCAKAGRASTGTASNTKMQKAKARRVNVVEMAWRVRQNYRP